MDKKILKLIAGAGAAIAGVAAVKLFTSKNDEADDYVADDDYEISEDNEDIGEIE